MKTSDLARTYGAAGHELRRLLLPGDIESFDAPKAEEARRGARRIVAYLNLAAGEWISKTADGAYTEAERKAKRILIRLGRRPRVAPLRPGFGAGEVVEKTSLAVTRATSSILTTVDRFLAASLLAAGTINKLPVEIQAFSYEEIAADVSDMASEAVRKHLSRGSLARSIVERLREIIGEEKFITILTTAGERTYRLRYYAEMVARTMLRDAQTIATLASCREFANDLVEVSSHGTDCPICLPYEGNIYSISGTHPKYPPLEAQTPFHPNCLHSILPTSEAEIYVRGNYVRGQSI